jgi:uncharacterized RDD family membrane protein YckC
MTAIPATLPYASSVPGKCPLCHKRPIWKKKIYGTPVCKKCFYAFANRRQLGYLVDAVIFIVPAIAINYPMERMLLQAGFNGWGLQAANYTVGTALACLFIMKDGFNGQSPGKRLANTQVLDERTSQPIQFAQSFKRNSILLVAQIPLLGSLASLVVILIIAMQVAKGYRLGDRFAKTRVIWKKYARLPLFGGTGLICETCSYDLYGNVSGTCPECGTPISEQNAAQLAAVR